MKPRSLALIFLAFAFLSACVPAMTTSPVALSQTPTMTASLIPAMTFTPSITPLPTIPTFTPTFDVRTIVTATPGEKALCPKENLDLEPSFSLPTSDVSSSPNIENDILGFLNLGGSMEKTVKRLSNTPKKGVYIVEDVTNDVTPELIFHLYKRPRVFLCDRGKYVSISLDFKNLPVDAYFSTSLEEVKDLNGNGVPEIVVRDRGTSGSGGYKISAFEWNGSEFRDLSPGAMMDGVLETELQDKDNDGIFEISLHGGLLGQCCMPGEFPARMFNDTYKWNGTTFIFSERQFDPPVFRFQAIQDADEMVQKGKLYDAYLFYDRAIKDKSLDWWSKQRAEYTNKYFYFHPPQWPDFSRPPAIEPNHAEIRFEYNSLAAYAYYRIMLLHIVRGFNSDAGAIYSMLQQKFPKGNAGYPYAEMATFFWNAYQSSHNMTNACGAAIQYAAEHPEILTPLGSDYHGAQSRLYKPADVCPFR